MVSAANQSLVRARANNRCEYCRLPQTHSPLKFEIDHIIARQHGGDDSLENLALACGFCNARKSPNIAGVDPMTQRICPLFHPRTDFWAQNFQWTSATLVGLTPVGRATVATLGMNHTLQLFVRSALLDEGVSLE